MRVCVLGMNKNRGVQCRKCGDTICMLNHTHIHSAATLLFDAARYSHNLCLIHTNLRAHTNTHNRREGEKPCFVSGGPCPRPEGDRISSSFDHKQQYHHHHHFHHYQGQQQAPPPSSHHPMPSPSSDLYNDLPLVLLLLKLLLVQQPPPKKLSTLSAALPLW